MRSAAVRRKHNLMIGEATAERIKIQLGSAMPPVGEAATIRVRGRHLSRGMPKEIVISEAEIAEAIAEPVSQIAGSSAPRWRIPPPSSRRTSSTRALSFAPFVVSCGGETHRDARFATYPMLLSCCLDRHFACGGATYFAE
jgi:hypothetical protein